jgi:glycosyltransferase involved in cell wall biosynthesis
MRIALFHDLPSGGAKRTLFEIVRRLAVRHAVAVYALDTANESFCDIRPYATSYTVIPFVPARLLSSPFGRINQAQRWRDLRRLATAGRAVAAAMDRAEHDVVYAQPSQWTQAPPLLLFAATPSLYDLHEPPRALYERGLNQRRTRARWQRVADRLDPLLHLYRAAARRLDRTATRAATRLAVNSRYTQAAVRQHYGCDAEVLYHGVDVADFRPSAGLARRPEVLAVGALQPSKAFDFLIAGLGRIAASRRPALRLVGNAEAAGERAHLRALAAQCGVALSIEIAIPDAALRQRYCEAALVACAAHREPFGLVPLEAMACATPVVAVAEGGFVESVLDGVTGRLVPRDPAAFASAVDALLGDGPGLRRMGDAGRALVCRDWTWDVAAARLEDALARAAQSPRGACRTPRRRSTR